MFVPLTLASLGHRSSTADYEHHPQQDESKRKSANDTLNNGHTQRNESSSAVNNSDKRSRTFFDYGGDYGHELGYRSDFYWLIPLIIVIGMGALLLPLMSALMTALVSTGAITLTAGRRRRRRDTEHIFASLKENALSETLMSLLTQIETAFDKFGHDINNKYQKQSNAHDGQQQ